MVLRLVGIVGLTLLPLATTAGPVGVHEALGHWLQEDGVGSSVRYRPVGAMDRPDDLPLWLLRPSGPDALNRTFIRRALYPEATSLDWRRGTGAVLTFGSPPEREGMRLVVDRERERPLLLRTARGVRWSFHDYRSRSGRRTGIPGRIVRTGPDGSETVLTPGPARRTDQGMGGGPAESRR